MSRLYLALVHYPVKDRAGATVTTSVTNLDVHDIARRSEERRVGKECPSKCRSRWSPYH